jgi:N-acetylglutamate synthase-like GNAT family acetyltransferase
MSTSTLPPLLTLRPATADDQAHIVAIIRKAGIYPLGLKWQRFIVAESEGRIVGVGQIKPHRFGARELGSIAVIPSRQKEGIARQIIEALLAREAGAVYLTCYYPLEDFYELFGFRRLKWQEMPLDFKGITLFLAAITPIGKLIVEREFKVLVMGCRAATP